VLIQWEENANAMTTLNSHSNTSPMRHLPRRLSSLCAKRYMPKSPFISRLAKTKIVTTQAAGPSRQKSLTSC